MKRKTGKQSVKSNAKKNRGFTVKGLSAGGAALLAASFGGSVYAQSTENVKLPQENDVQGCVAYNVAFSNEEVTAFDSENVKKVFATLDILGFDEKVAFLGNPEKYAESHVWITQSGLKIDNNSPEITGIAKAIRAGMYRKIDDIVAPIIGSGNLRPAGEVAAPTIPGVGGRTTELKPTGTTAAPTIPGVGGKTTDLKPSGTTAAPTIPGVGGRTTDTTNLKPTGTTAAPTIPGVGGKTTDLKPSGTTAAPTIPGVGGRTTDTTNLKPTGTTAAPTIPGVGGKTTETTDLKPSGTTAAPTIPGVGGRTTDTTNLKPTGTTAAPTIPGVGGKTTPTTN